MSALPPLDDSLSFRKLQVLLAFLETGNLARAAERLGTSPVSVHRALHGLEEAMRCALFRHEGRVLIPTEAAQVLGEVAGEVLRLMAEGVRATRAAGGYSADRLRLGALYSLTIHTVPALLMAMKLRLPALQSELVLGSNAELLRQLGQGGIDAALIGEPAAPGPELLFAPLFQDEIFFAAPLGSRYAAQAEVDLRDCAQERFVSLGEGFATHDGFQAAFRQAGCSPQIVMTTGDIFSLMNLVAGGIGCTLLPGRVRELFAQKVQLIPLAPSHRMRQTLGLVMLRARERDPTLLALLAACRTACTAATPG